MLTQSNILKNINLPNTNAYKQVGFRIAHTKTQQQLIQNIGPIFLTSANITNQKECYTFSEVREVFRENDMLTFLGHESEIGGFPPSDIFSFV